MSRPRALVAAVAACLLLAGCGSGPSQVRAAFLLGDTEVSQDTVQQLIDKAVREQPAAQQLSQQHKLDQLGREIVGQLAQHELLVKAARQEGLVADEATVSGLLGEDPLVTPVSANGVDPSQLARQIAYRARDHREVFTDYGLMQALGRKHFGGLSVTYDYTVVTSDDGGAQPQSMRDKAFAKAERMAASPAAADQVLREDAAAGVQTGSGQQISAVQSPAAASTVLFGVPQGTVVAFQPSQQDTTWLVAVVRQRDSGVPSTAQQSAEPTEDQLVSTGLRLLQPYSEQLRINPRYGVWDPVAMAVAPSAAESTGFVAPVKGSAQS
ncbi:hypothetical protein FHX82_001724 [Amycolatopsis bartoniae]|nr:hypothetical protein [Amycolatopsis bartoniae]MBB2934704.1 hypothetical protein [Amycolatopsis bartoniae]